MGDAARSRGKIERVVEASFFLTWPQKAVWLTDFRFAQMGTEGSYMSHNSLGNRLGMSGRSVESYRQHFVKLGICHRIVREGARNPGWRPFLPKQFQPTEGRTSTQDVARLAADFDQFLEGLTPDGRRRVATQQGTTVVVGGVRPPSGGGYDDHRTQGTTAVVGGYDDHRGLDELKPNGRKPLTASDRSRDRIRDRKVERSLGDAPSDLLVVSKPPISSTEGVQRSEGSHEPNDEIGAVETEPPSVGDFVAETVVDPVSGRLRLKGAPRLDPLTTFVQADPAVSAHRELPGSDRPPAEGTPVQLASAVDGVVARMRKRGKAAP